MGFGVVGRLITFLLLPPKEAFAFLLFVCRQARFRRFGVVEILGSIGSITRFCRGGNGTPKTSRLAFQNSCNFISCSTVRLPGRPGCGFWTIVQSASSLDGMGLSSTGLGSVSATLWRIIELPMVTQRTVRIRTGDVPPRSTKERGR